MVVQKVSLCRLILNHGSKRYNFADRKLNLCCGPIRIPGYIGVDICADADISMDLSKEDLPFDDNSQDAVVCISGINYFTRARAQEIVCDVHRVLRPGGIVRFGVQDLESIAKRYVEKDVEFFFQKNSEGKERFEGVTLGDKFVAWFYGYISAGSPCRYFYDFDSLALLFRTAGFSLVEKKQFQESRLEHIHLIDNRPDQTFFLEAVK